jgi:hypothetical protein
LLRLASGSACRAAPGDRPKHHAIPCGSRGQPSRLQAQGDFCGIAGTHTHGLDRFFASLYGKPVPGLAFFTLSLVSTQQRRSFPLRIEPVVRSDAEKAATKAQGAAKKQPAAAPVMRRPGRPKGSKNTPKADGTRTPECVRITGLLDALLHRLTGVVALTYVVLDGHFGNHDALQMAQEQHLQLIAKLRCDAALYFPYAGPYAGRVMLAAGLGARMAPRSMTTTSPSHTSKRPLSRGTCSPVSIRCHCSIKSSRNR